MLSYPVQRMQVVFGTILFVKHQIHLIFVNQILILFLHKSHHHINLVDPRLMKLTDQPFDQRLFFYCKKPLWYFHIYRNHPHPITSSQDNGITRFSLFQLSISFLCKFHI